MSYLLIFLCFLPSFAWLFFFLKEDIHPEPKKMIIRVFVGGIFAAIIAVSIQILLKNSFLIFQTDSYSFFSLFSFSFIEEIIKFLIVYLLIRKSRFFDEPIDAMIYMIIAALGFALLENFGVIYNVNILSEALSIMVLRFVGATLLHALSSGIIGYYWGKSLINKNNKIWINIAKGIIFATLLHTFFNYLIITSKDITIYPLILLIIAAIFIFWDFEKIKSLTSR
ncbi:PrsW family intramembrane metalloprotease [Candidatus Wolfebacteria bacterium]|nr:PrsW family intramembrane metalloprotease [Candidatus Wolfebacteria bacterium]